MGKFFNPGIIHGKIQPFKMNVALFTITLQQRWKNKSICFFLDKCPVNIKVLELSMPKSYK